MKATTAVQTVTFIVAAVALGPAATRILAAAGQADGTIADTEVEYTLDAGVATARVSVTNLTNEDVTPIVSGDNCSPSAAKTAVPPGTTATIEITWAECSDETRVAEVAFGQNSWTIVATTNETKPADAPLLRWFLIGGALACIVVVVGAGRGLHVAEENYREVKEPEPEPAPARARLREVSRRFEGDNLKARAKLRWCLPKFKAPIGDREFALDFSASWAANITAFTAALTGVIGSTDVLKAITGSEQDELGSIALVAGAIAAALVGAAVFLATSSRSSGQRTLLTYVLLAAATTGAAGFGLALTLSHLATRIELQGMEATGWACGITSTVLLALYLYVKSRNLIIEELPPPTSKADARGETSSLWNDRSSPPQRPRPLLM